MKTSLSYKNKIQGLKDVGETVKTLEKISASSIHLLRKTVTDLTTFTINLTTVLDRLILFYDPKKNLFLKKKKGGNKALLFITGDKGLVGGLWHNGINLFLLKNKKYKEVIVVGNKGQRYLDEENIKIDKLFNNLSPIPQKEKIEEITNYIFSQFQNGRFSQIDILYPKFFSLSEQKYSFIKFLPFEFGSNKKNGKLINRENSLGFPVFEPAKKEIFNNLLQKYIETSFFKIIMEAKLSELSARTVATEHAVVKTENLIKKINLDYRRNIRLTATRKQLESFTTHKTI